MKHRWLLLMASLFSLLVLFPATALSQGPTVHAGCGTATIDGVVGPGEWAPAAVVDMASPSAASQGTLLVMNDLTHLYVAQVAASNGVLPDQGFLHGEAFLLFTDEGDRLDDEWAAPDCDPLPGEGRFQAFVTIDLTASDQVVDGFMPDSEAGPCGLSPLAGVDWDFTLGPGDEVFEWAVDLNASELDRVGPGDCFRFGAELQSGAFVWPDGLEFEDPATFGTLCLNPCAELEFVPEPGSVILLGSGLIGLAGYAALRLRRR
jgi:hypothetical protein